MLTPGVYVVETSTLPPSVAEVATAIPAFIGYTAKGREGEVEVAQVSTLLEYEERFGRAGPTDFKARADGSLEPIDPLPKRMLWYALSLYFQNGGGRCWAISVDNESSELDKGRFEKGLEALALIDEPTLIVMPETVSLGAEAYKALCQAALKQCGELQDRFAILDVRGGDVDAFRNGVTAYLNYGAAYHPYLDTALTHVFDETQVTVAGSSKPDQAALDAAKAASDKSDEAARAATKAAADAKAAQEASKTKAADPAATDKDKKDAAAAAKAAVKAAEDARTAAEEAKKAADAAASAATPQERTLASLAGSETATYNRIKKGLADQRVRLPPCAAIAGAYARVDRERGVWKAPANVGLMSVVAPATAISEKDQERLNVDETSGKSINAIRSFAGRGTLVWGARTLAGNDNEWRYVPVRRLFITVEESARKASAFAVFEPNDANTWLKVRGMLESYLYGLWEQGALQGAEPKSAYYVNVGLGKTMTPQNILEGTMIVEIGLAAVRPAEFIVLRFSHKLAEA